VFVAHPEDADWTALDEAAGERWFIEQHEGIEWVAVLGHRPAHESVVGRVHGRREQSPVQPDETPIVVVLVLVAAALGYFDQHLDGSLRIHYSAAFPGGHPLIQPSSRAGRAIMT
jgi:hypothetical protein